MSTPRAPRTNVMLISCCSRSADRLSFYGIEHSSFVAPLHASKHARMPPGASQIEQCGPACRALVCTVRSDYSQTGMPIAVVPRGSESSSNEKGDANVVCTRSTGTGEVSSHRRGGDRIVAAVRARGRQPQLLRPRRWLVGSHRGPGRAGTRRVRQRN